jgi:hypothetical protein
VYFLSAFANRNKGPAYKELTPKMVTKIINRKKNQVQRNSPGVPKKSVTKSSPRKSRLVTKRTPQKPHQGSDSDLKNSERGLKSPPKLTSKNSPFKQPVKTTPQKNVWEVNPTGGNLSSSTFLLLYQELFCVGIISLFFLFVSGSFLEQRRKLNSPPHVWI